MPGSGSVILGSETVADVQVKTAALNTAVQSLARAFEADTACIIHSIQVLHENLGKPPASLAVIRTKVQIPG